MKRLAEMITAIGKAAFYPGRPRLPYGERAIAMQREVARLAVGWARRGYELAMGVGIAQGFATIGSIGRTYMSRLP